MRRLHQKRPFARASDALARRLTIAPFPSARSREDAPSAPVTMGFPKAIATSRWSGSVDRHASLLPAHQWLRFSSSNPRPPSDNPMGSADAWIDDHDAQSPPAISQEFTASGDPDTALLRRTRTQVIADPRTQRQLAIFRKERLRRIGLAPRARRTLIQPRKFIVDLVQPRPVADELTV